MEIRMQTGDWADQVTLASEKQAGEGWKLNTFSSTFYNYAAENEENGTKVCLDTHNQISPGMNARALLC